MQEDARATRRRGAALETAIVQAAIDEINECGFAAMTMDRVASRARTNKNAIYRRWPDRIALGVAAYRQMATAVPAPETGALRTDVLEMLRGANLHWSSPLGAVLRDLVAAAGGASPLLSDLARESSEALAADWLAVLERAVARGEISANALHPRVATVAIALLRNEFIVNGARTAPDEVLVDIVDQVYLPLVRARR